VSVLLKLFNYGLARTRLFTKDNWLSNPACFVCSSLVQSKGVAAMSEEIRKEVTFLNE
jgi:hypothetical protein